MQDDTPPPPSPAAPGSKGAFVSGAWGRPSPRSLAPVTSLPRYSPRQLAVPVGCLFAGMLAASWFWLAPRGSGVGPGAGQRATRTPQRASAGPAKWSFSPGYPAAPHPARDAVVGSTIAVQGEVIAQSRGGLLVRTPDGTVLVEGDRLPDLSPGDPHATRGRVAAVEGALVVVRADGS